MSFDFGADAATLAQLDRYLPDLNFPAIGFADVIDFLRDVTGANIVVRWSALAAAGIDRNAPVNARLSNVRFARALATILEDLGGGTVPVSYAVREGIITISTTDDLMRTVQPVTCVFDIQDLITEVPESNEEQKSIASVFDELRNLIMDTIAPDSWRDAGGLVGSIAYVSGQLVVTQAPENHREINRLLELLRQGRAHGKSPGTPVDVGGGDLQQEGTPDEQPGTGPGDSVGKKSDPAKKEDDASMAEANKDLPPSRVKAKAAYDWAMSEITGAEKMTLAELFDAIMNHPSKASEMLPPNAVAFGVYLRDAGVRRYGTRGDRRASRNVRRPDQI